MTHIRGHEPAEHEYVKKIVKETCYATGWIVGEEVVLPNGSRIDIIAFKDGTIKLFEITTQRRRDKTRDHSRNLNLEKYGGAEVIIYKVGIPPDRGAVESTVKKILFSSRGELK